jgi:hypothetical protein
MVRRHKAVADAGKPLTPALTTQHPSRVEVFERVIEPSWSSRSFTSLSRDADDDLNLPDHDQGYEPGLLMTEVADGVDGELLPIAAQFPRGKPRHLSA